jgi:formiminotetrahydrofolate cyclodeaminase
VLEQLRPIIHINVASDLQVGMQMLRSCLRGAIANMRTNLSDINDPDVRVRYEDMISEWEQMLRGN